MRNDEPTVAQKCRGVWTAVCEGREVEFTWDELQALQAAGMIKNLKKFHPYVGKRRGREERWTFEWTDKLLAVATAFKKFTKKHPHYEGPVCVHGVAMGHCPECPELEGKQ